MKQITARTADDAADLPVLAGTVSEGQTVTQLGAIKNTGDEALTSIRLWTVNDPAVGLTMTATVNGVAVPEAASAAGAVEVLDAPLAVGASVALAYTWAAPAALPLDGLDGASLRYVLS